MFGWVGAGGARLQQTLYTKVYFGERVWLCVSSHSCFFCWSVFFTFFFFYVSWHSFPSLQSSTKLLQNQQDGPAQFDGAVLTVFCRSPFLLTLLLAGWVRSRVELLRWVCLLHSSLLDLLPCPPAPCQTPHVALLFIRKQKGPPSTLLPACPFHWIALRCFIRSSVTRVTQSIPSPSSLRPFFIFYFFITRNTFHIPHFTHCPR